MAPPPAKMMIGVDALRPLLPATRMPTPTIAAPMALATEPRKLCVAKMRASVTARGEDSTSFSTSNSLNQPTVPTSAELDLGAVASNDGPDNDPGFVTASYLSPFERGGLKLRAEASVLPTGSDASVLRAIASGRVEEPAIEPDSQPVRSPAERGR